MGYSAREIEGGADVLGLLTTGVPGYPVGDVGQQLVLATWHLFSLILETDSLFYFWETNLFLTLCPFNSNKTESPHSPFQK